MSTTETHDEKTSAATPADARLVSVIVPMFDVAATLNECLASIESQTHDSLEIICVNDGSTDTTSRIAHDHAKRDSRIVVIDKTNEGYGAAMNQGIDCAQGRWIAIVEPDDVLVATCLEEMLTCAESLGGTDAVDVVRAPYWREFPDNKGGTTRVTCPYKGRVRPSTQPFAVGEGVELLRHHPAIWAALYRRDYLVEAGIRFVEAPGSGWVDNPFLAETLLRTTRIAYTDTCGYVYRERDLDEAESFAAKFPLVPLTRWNEMMDVACELCISDERVLAALALRGVNYAQITAGSAGLDEPEVRDLVTRSMKRLDADRVLADNTINPSARRLFAQVRGLPEPKINRVAYLAHLVGEGLYRMRKNGLAFALRTARTRRAGGRA